MGRKVTPKKAAEWRPVFLATLRETANVRFACQQAGISRKSAYAARNRSPDFARAWDDAIEDATDALEAIARKRACDSSDLLLIFLLKAHRPEKYRERHDVRHSGETVTQHVFDHGAVSAAIAARSGGYRDASGEGAAGGDGETMG